MVWAYFLLKPIQFLVMVLKAFLKNPPDCPILCNWVFESFILPDEPFSKALRSVETGVLVNNNLWAKLFSSLESPAKVFYSRF